MKIDRSFVSGVDHDANMRCLLESLISMAKSLGLTVIVEGVEQNDELKVLREVGCPLVQGYLFSEPRREAEFLRYLH
jgi:diguanylate cyclase